MNTLNTCAVPLFGDLSLDVSGLIRSGARITYVCRPNNPTGTQFERSAMLRLLREASGIVLIDEAYADYAGEDLIRQAISSERGIVLRTMSKAWGLAGLRIGYAIGPARLIAEIEKSRGPYKVNAIAEQAALAALAFDRDLVRDRIAEVVRNRGDLRTALMDRGLDVPDSAANFLLLRVPGSAEVWNRELRARGVAVRPFRGLRHVGESIRVSVGPWPAMQRFLDALDDVLKTQAGAEWT